MSRERTLRPRLVRYSAWLVTVLGTAFGIQVGLLAFPQVLVANKVKAGSVVVHYDGAPDPGIQILANDTNRRLRAGGFGDPGRPARLFLFRDQRLYSFFARLIRVPTQAQGFAISLLGNTYVSQTRVGALGDRTGRVPKYSVWEGSVPHAMAHEIAHLYMADSIGRGRWRDLPQWKQEGFPEYVANIALIREDTAASLFQRIEILADRGRWLGPRSWDRIHYEAGLLTEFLLDVQGYSLEQVVADSITRDGAYSVMMEWYWGEKGGSQPVANDSSRPPFP